MSIRQAINVNMLSNSMPMLHKQLGVPFFFEGMTPLVFARNAKPVRYSHENIVIINDKTQMGGASSIRLGNVRLSF